MPSSRSSTSNKDAWDEQRRQHLLSLAAEGDNRALLLELLATIHRDGGQYTELTGVAVSVQDAEKLVLALYKDNAALKARLKKLTNG